MKILKNRLYKCLDAPVMDMQYKLKAGDKVKVMGFDACRWIKDCPNCQGRKIVIFKKRKITGCFTNNDKIYLRLIPRKSKPE